MLIILLFCKMIGASEEQLDVFNEMWYCMLLNTGQATKGMNKTYLPPSKPHCPSLLMYFHTVAIEVLEKRIKQREGVPFMWRLLVINIFFLYNELYFLGNYFSVLRLCKHLQVGT